MEVCCFGIGILILIPIANAIWSAVRGSARQLKPTSVPAVKFTSYGTSTTNADERHRIDWERQRAIEKENQFEKKYTALCKSDDYKLVEQFAKKFDPRRSKREMQNLKSLLDIKQWSFSEDEVITLVEHSKRTQRIEAGKERILLSEPDSREETIAAFFEIANSKDEEMLVSLAMALQERRQWGWRPISALKTEIEGIEREHELRSFEKSLLDNNETDLLSQTDSMTGYEFEKFLGSLYGKMGYEIQATRLSGDQGADLVVLKFGEKIVIQAKRCAGRVGNKAVQEILGAISLYNARRGIVVTNSYFTSSAVELAKANKVELVNRAGLRDLINKHWY